MQYFYLLIFLNFLPLILATNPSCQFILEKMAKFHEEIKDKFKTNFDEKIGKEMAKNFENAKFNKELPSEILKAKVQVEEYSNGKKTLKDILKTMNKLKLEDKDKKALKELQNQLELKMEDQKKSTFRKVGNFITKPFGNHENLIEKQLKLVNFLVVTNELVNNFIDDVILELRIRQPINDYLKTLEYHINEQKEQLEMPYNDFVQKNKEKYFPKIRIFIEEAKGQLQEDYEKVEPKPKSATDIMSLQIEEDLDILKKAISKPYLEKMLKKPTEWHDPNFENMSRHINKAVDELLSKIADLFKNENKTIEEYVILHTKWDDLKLLNIASNKLLDGMKPFFEKNIEPNLIHGNWRPQNLVEICWLTEFTEKKLIKMKSSTTILIPNMVKAKKMKELPRELELNEEGKDKKIKAILIAQNVLFIAAQFNRIYNFENAISKAYEHNQFENQNEVKKLKFLELNDMIMENISPQSIGKFFYQKYVKSETEMSAKREHHSAADESSSANVGGSEGKDEKMKAIMQE